MGWLSALLLLTVIGEVWNLSCLWTRKSTQSGLCRAELAENIVYAKVLAVYKKKAITHSEFIIPSIFPEPYSAEMELLCNPSSHSWQLGATGTRFNLTGLGIADCRSYSLNVIENNTYYFFVRRDENGNLVPHEVNEQDPIFSDTPENKQMFSSIVQFSNCVSGTNLPTYSPELEQQEDNQPPCSIEQMALYEKVDQVRMLNQKVKSLEKSINHLREKVKGTKRSLRQVKKESS
ncbi:coiled-coil domain-containing protein 3-like isoform X2 [Amblyraja radiata]|uniref:coiled-coil domain-containing protein 3-like isoform X2 n=1 Tax=Amblyraja radiata TaxID=386614 RepID=UPI001402F210|nr:coiled-coil domain-containing protein 3-like isoform X2 [Amblyraja radiata]